MIIPFIRGLTCGGGDKFKKINQKCILDMSCLIYMCSNYYMYMELRGVVKARVGRSVTQHHGIGYDCFWEFVSIPAVYVKCLGEEKSK